jgi:DNA helicase-2/ATP-dependent DNA helicase PcrA
VDRLENVQELIAGAAEWSELAGAGALDEGEEPTTPLARYLTQVTLVSPADQSGPDVATSGVTLMTVHMAKGLEWHVVALTGLEDGLFPLARSVGTPGGLEEERRLCYVGLTRAREKLYLSWARTRYRNGRLELSDSSRFLEAVPSTVIEEQVTGARWGASAARRRPRASGEGERAATSGLVDAPGWDDEPSQDAPRYANGERVRHRKFGAGVVRGVQGSGRELKVTVAFDDPDIGTKQLLVAYAGLEREWGGESA